MKRLLLLVPLALAGCYTAPGPQPAAEPYRALGTEPFWAVTIAEGRMTYESPEGGFSVPAPSPRTSFNGHRYETPRLTVDVTHGRCSDGMSDRIYADTVMVIADGRTLNGCGGEILPPDELAGTSWSIAAIGSEPVSGDAYYLQFGADRVSGKAGCNGFSGPYRVEGDVLTAGPLAATRMACPEPRMRHETQAFAILRSPVHLDYIDGDNLVLRNAAGSITLRRSI